MSPVTCQPIATTEKPHDSGAISNVSRFASSSRLTGLCVSLVILLFFHVTGTQAAGPGLTPLVYQQLTSIHTRIDREEYNSALKALNELLTDISQRSYDKAVVLQTLGFVQVSRENYPAAIHAFEQSLALEQLPDDTQQRMRYDLAQLHLAMEQPGRASAMLEKWFKQATDPSAEAFMLLGHAYLQQKRYRKAVPRLKQAIRIADKPRADWYEALLSAYYELKSYTASIPLLKDMIRLFPERKKYWQQLAGVHLTLGDHGTALAVLELAYRDGALVREQELLQLARLYLFTGIPYKAADFIEQEMNRGRIRRNLKNRELLAEAWTASRERKQAIASLESVIAKGGKPGLRLRLAQWYFEEERWRDAEEILHPLTSGGGGGKDVATAWFLLGVTRFEQGNTRAALDAFRSAVQYPELADSAQQWLDFIESSSG